MSEVSEKPTGLVGQDDKPVTIETDMVVFGYMAAHWADTGGIYGCCKRGWGSELRGGAIQVGNDTFTAGKTMSDKHPVALAKYGPGRLGMLLTRHVNNRNGGTEQRSLWMPMEAFKKARLLVDGCAV